MDASAPARALPGNLAMANVTPATRLLEKRRQMFEVQEALEAQKQDFARKEELFRKREEALKRRDLELQESLIRFSRFLQENDSKRARAEKKAADEVRARQAKEAEISQLTELVEQLSEERERIDVAVDRRMSYQHYLESVLEVADEYQEIGELLGRHATLQDTNRDLRAHMAHCDEEAESLRSELAAFTKRRSDELLLLNNRLAALKQQLEAHEQDAALQKAAKDGTLAVAGQRTLVYGQVVLAADNLWAECKRRSHVAHAPHTDPTAQLEVIGNFVADLAAICRQGGLGAAAAAGGLAPAGVSPPLAAALRATAAGGAAAQPGQLAQPT
ncbi:flagellar associated protein [Raphidocelis subcapitata]|uniref:Flagellar associated protein n=1 Tax=Raphidocelis subcapitata TaxID=307507 RepID=A0A2V0PBW6_9CHLO|nr:flagellar associated protein [Raphidocelis subcapitata]|eukprot:GBF97344.1 flagellar associated protein [Raphidocelis subcapitata]